MEKAKGGENIPRASLCRKSKDLAEKVEKRAPVNPGGEEMLVLPG